MTVRADAKSVGKKKHKRRNVYDRNESDLISGRSKKISFKDRLRRSFRINRKKSYADEGVISRRNRNPKLSYIFCSFRKSVRKPNKMNELPGDLDEDESCPYEKINKETDSINDYSYQPGTDTNDTVISDNELNNNNTKDDTVVVVVRNNSTKSQQRSDTDCTNKVEYQVPITPIYPESIIASYNVKTRYFLSKLFNIKNAFSKTKVFTNVVQDDKNTTSSSKVNTCPGTLESSKGCTYTIEKGKDRSSIIISLNDENNHKRSSILINLNDLADRPKPSYIIPLNDMDRSSSSSVLFSGLGDDEMDLSYLIEYANQAFDGRVYKLEDTRDIVGGSEDNILENGSPLYHSKEHDSEVCRSHDVLCTQQRTSMCESLHLGDGDDDDVVIAEGPELIY